MTNAETLYNQIEALVNEYAETNPELTSAEVLTAVVNFLAHSILRSVEGDVTKVVNGVEWAHSFLDDVIVKNIEHGL